MSDPLSLIVQKGAAAASSGYDYQPVSQHGGEHAIDVGGGHVHGPGCKHGHGDGKKKDLKYILHEHGQLVRVFNYMAVTLIGILDYILIIPAFGPGRTAILEYLFVFMLWLLVVTSFYICSTTNSQGIKVANPPQYNTYKHVKNDAMCDKCKVWKPSRTRHCSVCQSCIAKMDHHCPWMDNCIGAYNHKSFFLYCLYMTIGSSHFLMRSAMLLYKLYTTGTWSSISYPLYWYWFSMICLGGPALIAVWKLFSFHLEILINNLTTLEKMGGAKVKNPFTYQPTPVNVFDRGIFGNIVHIFGESMFMWFIPTRGEFYNDCTSSQNNAIITISEYQARKNMENPELMKKYAKERKFDYQAMIEKAHEVCHGKHMQLNYQMYEFKERS